MKHLTRRKDFSSRSITVKIISLLSYATTHWFPLAILLTLLLVALPAFSTDNFSPQSADDILVVDCLLPGQIKRLGRISSFIGPRRPIKTTAVDCGIRGGEFVSYDRSNYKTALNIWQSEAKNGNAKAQNYLGEIYEKGLGIDPNYRLAVKWYQRAAEQGFAAAQINLGVLYESGRGVTKDMGKALYWYRQASGLSSLQAAPELQLMDTNTIGAGPTIQIIDPVIPQTRGILRVSVKPNHTHRIIVGRIISQHDLASLTINNKSLNVNKSGIFKTKIPLNIPSLKVTIVATDTTGQQSIRSLVLNHSKAISKQASFGRYHALVIGNNNYKNLNSLSTAKSDAKKVSTVLKTKYNFQVTTIYDGNRSKILNALNNLRKTLTDEDNLLIYYAGHGVLDQANNRGNWLPVDADIDSTTNWISNIALTDILNIMSAKHVLVVADSCYSGTLTRSVLTQLRAGQSDAAKEVYFQRMQTKRSRTALTSGAIAPVLDTGSKGHSVFAGAFIDILQSNQGILEGHRLFLEISARVTKAAYDRRFDQTPQYAPIKYAGHEAGDFFLIPGS